MHQHTTFSTLSMSLFLCFNKNGDGCTRTCSVHAHCKLNLAVEVGPAKLHAHAGTSVCRCVCMYYASPWEYDPNVGIEFCFHSKRKNLLWVVICVQRKGSRLPVDSVSQSQRYVMLSAPLDCLI